MGFKSTKRSLVGKIDWELRRFLEMNTLWTEVPAIIPIS